MIQGITVELITQYQTGADPFGAPITEDVVEYVNNVLVAPVTDAEIIDTLNLTGRRAVYQLGIPKDDAHDWTGAEVRFFGDRFRVIGKPTKGIDELIPLDWNTKVQVERIE